MVITSHVKQYTTEGVDQAIPENQDYQSHGGVGQKRQEIGEIILKRNKRTSKHE